MTSEHVIQPINTRLDGKKRRDGKRNANGTSDKSSVLNRGGITTLSSIKGYMRMEELAIPSAKSHVSQRGYTWKCDRLKDRHKPSSRHIGRSFNF